MSGHITTLVIFDYSGTLSLGAIRFGTPEYLMNRLTETGLEHCGVTGTDIFWHDIVNPTWHEGSTTSIGYTHLMVRQLMEISKKAAIAVSGAEIHKAAFRFVESYFAHSFIDRQWLWLLGKLVKEPSVLILIATDHYAEATDAIIRSLQGLGVAGVSLKDDPTGVHTGTVKIANSADMGFHKNDRRFWTAVQSRVPYQALNRIVYVDDFGYNESAESDYSVPGAVEKRMHATISILKDVFSTEVVGIPFLIEKRNRPEFQKNTMPRRTISEIALKVWELCVPAR